MSLELKSDVSPRAEVTSKDALSGEQRPAPDPVSNPSDGQDLETEIALETGKKRRGILKTLIRLNTSVKRVLFSSLTRRIVTLNMAALAILLATILYMNQFRAGLTDARIESLLTQGRIIAGAIASSASAETDIITVDPEKLLEIRTGESLQSRLDPLDNLQFPISPEQVAPVLRALIKPTQTRARIYDPDGIMIIDSRFLYDADRIQQFDLPRLDGTPPPQRRIGWTETIGNWLNWLLRDDRLAIYREIEGAGTQYPEVQSALTGAPRSVVRITEKGKMTVSVAVPIQRFRAVLGVLLLSTEGDDIDRIVRDERIEILRIFLVAFIVMFVLSALLASTIANPLRKLAAAAVKVRMGVKTRVGIPDFSQRNDEIGELSTSVAGMTNALYLRIEAIERFAADVSHELKNPLTSLRSAVETLPIARNEESRRRLLDIIQHDVMRLDRLITDISDASRLDADLVREKTKQLDFAALARNVVEASAELHAKQKNVVVSFSLDPGFQAAHHQYRVSGHGSRLGQVINNLIDNAVSFVPEGSGKVNVTMKLNKRTKQLSMIVEDNGRGILADDIDRIFDRFYTDRADRDGFGQNSGLGLSISRQIIEAHGGSIRAENRSGGDRGARFIVTLPYENADK